MVPVTVTSIVVRIFLGLLAICDFFSLIFYILLLIFMIKRRLKNDKVVTKQFHTLCIFNGILDILFIVEEYFSNRFPLIGFFQNFYLGDYTKTKISGLLYIFTVFYILYVSLSGITLTFNRYYAIVYPLKYDKNWSGGRLVFLTIWPALLLSPLFIIFYGIKVNFVIESESGRMALTVIDPKFTIIIWQMTLTTHLVAIVINGFLNVMVIRGIKNHIKSSIRSYFFAKFNSTMAKYAFFYFATLTFVVILEVLIFIFFSNQLTSLGFHSLTVYTLAQSLIAFYSPYALILTNKEIRKKFLKDLNLKKFFKHFNLKKFYGKKN
uniref:Serpentine receptor class gamma n=1 Tax=Strongyloides papillosus TaxID=174720 RepID=A0A0N5CH70_STREA